MKTISVRDLHMHTGRFVHQGSEEKLVVTDRGRPVAVLSPIEGGGVGAPLPDREAAIRRLPRLRVDSSTIISDDRDRA